MVAPAEQTIASQSNIAALQEGRHLLADQTAANTLRQTFTSVDASQHSFAIANVERDVSGWYDEMTLSAKTLLSLEAIGVDTADILQKTGRGSGPEEEVIATKIIAGDQLIIGRLADGVTLKLHGEYDEKGKPSVAIKQAVVSRLQHSPAFRAMAEATDQFADDAVVPQSISTKPFNYREDPLSTMIFLNDIGLASTNTMAPRLLRNGTALGEVTDQALTMIQSDELITRNDTPNTTTFSWGAADQRQLSVDLVNGTMVFQATQKSENLYQETADQSQDQSVPFIETSCAQALGEQLDAAGLMFHPKLQREMMQIKSADRYGSIYTQLSREVAKWVNSPNRLAVSNLFVPIDARFQGKALAEQGESGLYNYEAEQYDRDIDQAATEAAVREQVMTMSSELTSEPASALIQMSQDVLRRNQSESIASDLPITNEQISMLDGACFDVATYYVSAAGSTRLQPENLQHMMAGNTVPMLEKREGKHTYLTTEPSTFNGVRLPKGSLFTTASDGGWAFLRLTPFAFDAAADQVTFGSEISKMAAGQWKVLKRIGSASLAALQAQATNASK